VIASVNDSSKLANGLSVKGDKYILVRSDPGVSILLKKGASGLVAYKSTQSKFDKIFLKSELISLDLENANKLTGLVCFIFQRLNRINF
jgi:hypothetical protein